jgi:hypothetical protein
VGSCRSASGLIGLESGHEIRQLAVMHSWSRRYTQRELDDAQERYCLRFPPDLIAMLLERQPAPGYDWKSENDTVRQMLAWPLEVLLFDVENGFWWPDWGERPDRPEARNEVVESSLKAAPRLIPIIGHRFIPEEPSIEGNPVFSMHGFDTIYYGANLAEYLSNEFEGLHEIGSTRHIPFWSDIVERPDDAYDYYAATGAPQADIAAIQEALRNKDG